MTFINYLTGLFIMFLLNLLIRLLYNRFYKNKFSILFIFIDNIGFISIFILSIIIGEILPYDYDNTILNIVAYLLLIIGLPALYINLKKKYLLSKKLEISIYYPLVETLTIIFVFVSSLRIAGFIEKLL